MRTLLAFYTITNILNGIINDYRTSNNDRVIIEESEKSDIIPEKGDIISENVENIDEIINKTHEFMDTAPLVQ